MKSQSDKSEEAVKPATYIAIGVGALGGFIVFLGAAILQYLNDAGHGPINDLEP